MTLIVCPLARVAAQCAALRPSRIISLLSPDMGISPAPCPEARQINFFFNDVAEPRDGLIAPDEAAIRRLLEFGAEDTACVTLIYCWAGISRSPAAAFALACQRHPGISEREIALLLRLRAPAATPNPLMVRLADMLLGRGGRMIAAIASIGRGCEASEGAMFEIDCSPIHSAQRTLGFKRPE